MLREDARATCQHNERATSGGASCARPTGASEGVGDVIRATADIQEQRSGVARDGKGGPHSGGPVVAQTGKERGERVHRARASATARNAALCRVAQSPRRPSRTFMFTALRLTNIGQGRKTMVGNWSNNSKYFALKQLRYISDYNIFIEIIQKVRSIQRYDTIARKHVKTRNHVNDFIACKKNINLLSLHKLNCSCISKNVYVSEN